MGDLAWVGCGIGVTPLFRAGGDACHHVMRALTFSDDRRSPGVRMDSHAQS